MKVILVAMSDSIHTSRWIGLISDQGWTIHLFPSKDNNKLYDSLKHSNINIAFFLKWRNNRFLGLLFVLYKHIMKKANPNYYEKRLARLINKVKPDIIHSLETQSAGYLVSSVKEKFFSKKQFPVWWHTNWGSDIYLFGRLSWHQEKIQNVLKECDYYSCECERDVNLAIKHGFKGYVLDVYPNTGGFDIGFIDQIRKKSEAPSQRKLIMIKGYQGWAGRALVGFRALARCADVLKGYEVVVFTNTNALDIQIAANLLFQSTGVPVHLLPEHIPNSDILTYQSKAKISIGLSISDAISTSLLEAMALGSFPIQSNTACATEWIIDGETGFIVPPEDPEIIEIAIRKALQDDNLVNEAMEKNFSKISNNANHKIIKEQTISAYKKIKNKALHY